MEDHLQGRSEGFVSQRKCYEMKEELDRRRICLEQEAERVLQTMPERPVAWYSSEENSDYSLMKDYDKCQLFVVESMEYAEGRPKANSRYSKYESFIRITSTPVLVNSLQGGHFYGDFFSFYYAIREVRLQGFVEDHTYLDCTFDSGRSVKKSVSRGPFFARYKPPNGSLSRHLWNHVLKKSSLVFSFESGRPLTLRMSVVYEFPRPLFIRSRLPLFLGRKEFPIDVAYVFPFPNLFLVDKASLSFLQSFWLSGGITTNYSHPVEVALRASNQRRVVLFPFSALVAKYADPSDYLSYEAFSRSRWLKIFRESLAFFSTRPISEMFFTDKFTA